MAKKKKLDVEVGQRHRIKDLVIERLSLVGDGERVTLVERKRHKRKLTVHDYLDDLTAYPDDSVRKRAKRLRVDRQTIRRLEKEREDNTFVEFSGPVLLAK